MNENVNVLDSIKSLEEQGFEGGDVCLATSLFEYGLAYRQEGNETLFVYAIGADPLVYNRFDRCTFASDVDVQKEFDWADFGSLYSFVGMDAEQWNAQPLTSKVSDLLSFYGFENVFGSSYWEGFEIKEEE
jgi:hypothetical protein